MLNVVAIMGRLVADPELRTTTQGHSVCSFHIACDRSCVQQGQERQADFIDIVAWRQQADFVSKYFRKGSVIAVEGSLQTRQYQDKQGSKRTAVEVVANNISFAGAKRQDSQRAPSYEQQTTSHVQQAKAAQDAPQPAYTQGSMDDFAVINDNDDLPF
ncbi:single-stranded DNA-binding protein [Hominenteromicrobium sp.]|uniref:single-stranded DNA-binding protein n=1 Tax=Hominenteromicrobium sp. TaxID=3073581 RepID=UPI003AF1A31D